MPAEKEKPESTEKPASAPAVATPSAAPDKSDGPQPLARTADQNGGATERARIVESMQQQVGNARVGRMFAAGVQRKAEVSSPEDASEKEADHMAETVMRMSDNDAHSVPTASTTGAQTAASSGGQPLSKSDRDFMEPRFGRSFGNVRLHTDGEAQRQATELGAKAFTHGSDISFGPGSGPDDKKLMAHELTHVAQQDQRSPDSQLRRRSPNTVQRVLAIAGTDLNTAGLRRTQDEIVTTHLADIVDDPRHEFLFTRSYRERLVRDTVLDMHQTSDRQNYGSVAELARDVRERVLASLYMRQSQGSTTWRMAFSYPDRPSDGTAGVGPRVNQAAIAYWGPVQYGGGLYFFEMNNAGRADAYNAIVSLFTEQTNPHLRTLIHCDYVISVIRYRSWIESIGAARFNEGVRRGITPAPVLRWNGFSDLAQPMNLPPAAGAIVPSPDTPLRYVPVASEADLIIGDHVVFYNHPTYDALTAGDPRAIWRLENAILIDRQGGDNRYQGHGYFSPVGKSTLLAGMIRQYNLHVAQARRLTNAVDRARTPTQQTAATTALAKRFPNVHPKVGGGWEISGSSFCGTPVSRDLSDLTVAEAPGLVDPCTHLIWASRPVHTRP
jgi:Domain of unknown function (DUF4157)